jgi:hypothetical protein
LKYKGIKDEMKAIIRNALHLTRCNSNSRKITARQKPKIIELEKEFSVASTCKAKVKVAKMARDLEF